MTTPVEWRIVNRPLTVKPHMKKAFLASCCIALFTGLTIAQDTDESWKTIPPTMKVIAKNEDGEPIKDVEMFLNISGRNLERTYRSTLHTDENGVVIFDLAEIQGRDFETFRMWIRPKDRYVAQFLNRDRLDVTVYFSLIALPYC